MSGAVFTSLSVWTAWEKLFSFLQAFTAVSSLVPSASAWVAMDLEELRKLERTTQRILATLHDAEVHWNIQQESTKLRLRELKEVACDVKGVVMEYEYEADRCKLEALKRSARYHYTGKRKRHEVYHRKFEFASPIFALLASLNIQINSNLITSIAQPISILDFFYIAYHILLFVCIYVVNAD
jgi:hypothetical protein